jgi:chaperonin cofactor prefoldin
MLLNEVQEQRRQLAADERSIANLEAQLAEVRAIKRELDALRTGSAAALPAADTSTR